MRDRRGSGWKTLERLGRAVEGDREALGEATASEALAETAVGLGLGPALALAADRLGLDVPPSWRRALTGSMSTWLLVDEALRRVAGAFDAVGVAWAPIKGYDVGTRFYAEREVRPTADLDVLVAEGDFDAARGALEAAGWRNLGGGGERQDAYLRDEGYAWQASGPVPVALEVHFRLWGMVPAGVSTAMLDRAEPDAALGASARRLTAADAYLLAAIHAWTKERPRGLLDWLDLERIACSLPSSSRPEPRKGRALDGPDLGRIARTPSSSSRPEPPKAEEWRDPGGSSGQGGRSMDESPNAEIPRLRPASPASARDDTENPSRQEGGTPGQDEGKTQSRQASQQEGGTSRQEGGTWLGDVVTEAVGWDLELPVALSAVLAERLWPGSVHGAVAAGLGPRLRGAEQAILDRLAVGGPDAVSYRDVVLARLRSRRASRMGWRSVWRRLWPHPGTVDKETPGEWGWPRRRLKLLLEAVFGARPA